MKKVYILLITLFIGNYVYTQTILAGQSLANGYYFDIVPDTLLRVYGPYWYSGSYDIDINGDRIMDFKIVDYSSWGLGGGYGGSYISALNRNEIAFAFYDSCFGNPNVYPPPYFISRTKMAHSFRINDTINNYSVWIDSTAYMDYTKWAGGFYGCGNSTFSNSESRYLGVRVFLYSDTLYGWIKLRNKPVILEEFACNKKSTNIIEFRSNIVKLYPNPTTDAITIELVKPLKNCMLIIMNTNGLELIKQQIKDRKTIIEISNLTSGIYFVKLVTDKTVEMLKLVKN